MNLSEKICVSKTCEKKSSYASISWLPAIVIAILPKCPFCIMAYSGAMSLCSGKMIFPNAHSYSGYFIVGISLIVILGILLNYKGRITCWSAGCASLGVAIITISQFVNLSEPLYYLGVFVLFFGIWLNGSFTYFNNRFFKRTINIFNHKIKT